MNKLYLSIGGNLGEKLKNLQKACELIELGVGKITLQSSVYETAAWGNEAQPSFLNQVLLIETDLTAIEALHAVQKIEHSMGRIRSEKYGPRVMDIDILYYNDLVFQNRHLTIPHPEIAKRKFVLIPLAEIAPDWTDPVTGRTITALLHATEDLLEVNLYTDKHA